jgi:hypothetical protein
MYRTVGAVTMRPALKRVLNEDMPLDRERSAKRPPVDDGLLDAYSVRSSAPWRRSAPRSSISTCTSG